MVKEGRSKDDHTIVVQMAGEFLKQMCGTSAAMELTPHFLVKHSFEIANAFVDEIMKDDDELFKKWNAE